jgi:hypothetical protein
MVDLLDILEKEHTFAKEKYRVLLTDSHFNIMYTNDNLASSSNF